MADQGRLRLPEAPVPLTPEHDLATFHSGTESLDEWLRRRALANQLSGATRTFVVLDGERSIVGFYSLATGAIAHESSPSGLRRNMPNPLPVIVLARMAVATAMQGRGLGAALLQDAVKRCMKVASQAGVRALLVHAIDEQAAGFYRHHGFIPSPIQPMTWMLPLARVRHGDLAID